MIGLDDGDGFIRHVLCRARFVATQREVADVDAVLTQHPPDMSDYARDIVVLKKREVSGQRYFDWDAVDGDEPGTVEHDCAFHRYGASVGVQFQQDGVYVGALAGVMFLDLPPAVGGQRHGIDEIGAAGDRAIETPATAALRIRLVFFSARWPK